MIGRAARASAIGWTLCLALPALAAPKRDALPPPIPLERAAVLLSPTVPVFAYALSLANPPLTAPVSVELQCLVDTRGAVVACLPSATHLPRKIGYLEFVRLADGHDRHVVDHGLTGLARLVARTYLLRPANRPRIVRLAIRLDPADARSPRDLTLQPSRSYRLEPDAGPWGMTELYPAVALANDTRARVRMRCRVLPDRTLACRDGRVEGADVGPAEAEAFIAATSQLLAGRRVDPKLASGANAVGTEAEFAVLWSLPG